MPLNISYVKVKLPENVLKGLKEIAEISGAKESEVLEHFVNALSNHFLDPETGAPKKEDLERVYGKDKILQRSLEEYLSDFVTHFEEKLSANLSIERTRLNLEIRDNPALRRQHKIAPGFSSVIGDVTKQKSVPRVKHTKPR